MALSVVIPTLNEAGTLPVLLDALAAQSTPPAEVIVADAGSTDGTPEIAAARGARVVPGGMPAVGRNAGARAATGDLLLFLDADVVPPRTFVKAAFAEFELTGLDVATCLIAPLGERFSDRVSADATNLYLQIVQPLSPHAPGFCILSRRSIHEAICGFDETLMLAEDHDYVQRAARIGRFGVLTSVRIPVSMRRLEREGLSRLAIKYIWCEMHALAGRPIRSVPFEYEFGTHGAAPEVKRHRLMDIQALRGQIGRRFEDPLQSLSAAARRRVDALVEQDNSSTRQVFAVLDAPDLTALHRYVRRRRALLRLTRRQALDRLAAIQAAPPGEWLDLLVPRRAQPPRELDPAEPAE